MNNLQKEALGSSIAQIEEANELAIIERNNEIRLQFQAEARKRIIMIWLPLISLGLIILGWMLYNVPNYNGCIKSCLKDSETTGVRGNNDCEFYCNIRYN